MRIIVCYFSPDTTKQKVNPLGTWNKAHIVSKGKHVEPWLNGKKILEFESNSEAYLPAVAKSE